MTSAIDITGAVNPPRAVFVDYPLGHTAGKPGDPANQRAIMIDALQAFERLAKPGEIVKLPYQWDDDGWKRHAMAEGDTRSPRTETPQYQLEEDRAAAKRNENREADGCLVCADYSAPAKTRP
jgi:hypothetical protein